MTQEQIFEVVKRMIKDVLFDVADDQIAMDSNLEALGANSVDRADISTQCMQALDLKLSPAELAAAKDVGSLVILFYRNLGHGADRS